MASHASELPAQKSKLRRHYRAVTRSLSYERQAPALFRQLTALCDRLSLANEQPTLAFVGVHGEFDTRKELDRRLQAGGQIYIPRCEGTCIQDGIMEFYRYTGSADLVEGPYGLLEPKPRSPLPSDALPLVWVPGLAFEASGARLGKGGGFYDRYLARPQMRGALTIGLCPDEAIAPSGEIPTGPLDMRVNWVVTPTQLIECIAPAPGR